MSIIETIKKVNGRFFKGNISSKGFEMTHFISHQPAVSITKRPNDGWSSDGMRPPINLDGLITKVAQNFAVLSVDQIDIMIEELHQIKAEMK